MEVEGEGREGVRDELEREAIGVGKVEWLDWWRFDGFFLRRLIFV